MSGGLHLAALLALLIGVPRARIPDPPDDPIEVVVINRPPEVAGGGATGGAAGVRAPASRGVGEVPAGGAVHASAPAPPAALAAQPKAAPQERIGPGDAVHDVEGTDEVLLEGNVVPAAPDSAYQNMTPAFPPLAKALGESGTVGLLAHVDPDGLVSNIDVLESSGWPVLDDAATDALSKWHFKPAPGGASFAIRFHFEGPGAP